MARTVHEAASRPPPCSPSLSNPDTRVRGASPRAYSITAQGSSSITVSSRQYYTSSTSSCAEYHKIQIDQLAVTIMRPWRCRTSKTGDEDNGDRHTLAGTVATKTESPGGTTSLAIN